MNIKEIKELLQLMAEHELTEIEIEKDGMTIKLKKGASGRLIAEGLRESPTVVYPMPKHEDLPGMAQGSAGDIAVKELNEGSIVKSPMVGTFYHAPAPDQPPYVSVGNKVAEGDVLCIIEAMKLMNEIKIEFPGIVTEIMVKNGQPVEFDQELFRVKKA